jgi:hypothetical protein
MLYFAVRVANQTNCGECETPVLEEIDDLFWAKNQGRRDRAQKQESHVKNTNRSEDQGPLAGTEALLARSSCVSNRK